MMAVGCIAGLSHIAYLLALTAISGGVMAVLLALARGRLQQTIMNVGELAAHHSHQGLQPHPDLNLTNTHTLATAVCPGDRRREPTHVLLSASIGVQDDNASTHLSLHHRPGGLWIFTFWLSQRFTKQPSRPSAAQEPVCRGCREHGGWAGDPRR